VWIEIAVQSIKRHRIVRHAQAAVPFDVQNPGASSLARHTHALLGLIAAEDRSQACNLAKAGCQSPMA
jgi:hypothetical protein